MRVTAEVQAATRQRILEVAQRLLASQDFDVITTRDIAKNAKIATGTLFNYFPSKEAILASLAAEAQAQGQEAFERNRGEGASLEEDLFALAAGILRRLKPYRRHLPVLLGSAFNSAPGQGHDESHRLRISHLDAVGRLAQAHGFKELTVMARHMYWSLYAGMILFWANDDSPRQEDTLALLDHSLEMYLAWLMGQGRDLQSTSQEKQGVESCQT